PYDSNVGNKIADFYLKGLNDDNKKELFKAVADGYGDSHLTCPTVLFGQFTAKWIKNNNLYSYMLSHSSPHNYIGKDLQDVYGVTHSDDLFYLFGTALRDKTTSKENIQMSYDMINAWTTFAKTG